MADACSYQELSHGAAKFSSDAFLIVIDKMQSQPCSFMAEYKFSVLQPFV